MAYYDELKAAWNGTTQPPTGVTGQPLLSTDTTDQKLAKVNAWTVTGAVPTTVYLTSDQIANCIVYSEFKALQSAQESNVLNLLNIPTGAAGGLVGGTANTTLLAFGMILDLFPAGSGTRQNLNALVRGNTYTWCQDNSYPYFNATQGNLSRGDTDAAGLV
jgi:hypothetical protein